MSTENPNPQVDNNPAPNTKYGLLIVLVFLIGIPLIGVLATIFGYNNN